MASRANLATKNKWCHLFTFSLLEELYPRSLLAELLSALDAWEERERKRGSGRDDLLVDPVESVGGLCARVGPVIAC